MPYRPNKPCAFSRCPNLVPVGKTYCPKHQPYDQAQRQRQDRDRGTAWSRGYDSEWRRLRDHHLKANPLCSSCLKNGILRAGTCVDHIRPFQDRSDPLRLDPNNLQTLCAECHAIKTATQDGGFGNNKRSP